MVAERAASPEPVATVINDPEGAAHRPSAVNPSRPPPTLIGRRRSPVGGAGRNCGSLTQVRAVSFEASSLVENFASYKASGHPSRVLYYGGEGAWTDFTGDALAALRRAFAAGRTSVELVASSSAPVRGEKPKPTLVDFLRMLQTDLETGRERSVAWIDVRGRCFFPKKAVGGGAEEGQMLEIDVVDRTVSSSSAFLSSPPFADVNPIANANQLGGAVKAESMATRWDESGAVQTIDRAEDYHKHVERMFLTGMRTLYPEANVTAIRRCTHAGAHGASRLRAFVSQGQFTKSVRGGEANVRAAWYTAATPDEVDEAVRYGFSAPNCDRLYGTGVYLVPPQAMHLQPPPRSR